MTAYLISLYEASKYMELLKGLPISQIISDDTGCIVVGFGQCYQVSNISYGPNGAYEKTQEVAHFQIKSRSAVQLVDSSDITRICDVNSNSCLEHLNEMINGVTVKTIEFRDNHNLTVTLNALDSILIITPEWEFSQPCTEEDVLLSNGRSITKKTQLCRRWSREFPYHRHKWHTF